ncbi:MAG: hypothetical protein IJU02_05560 [Lachnospiraceae bacterium]|nr:hypothetical protein [Lachnospiraceae bacterium]
MDLEQAKRRDKKVSITDEAIKKIPKLKYPTLTDIQNEIVTILASEVLELSKNENECNEVAITYCLEDDQIGISYGDEHGVNPLSDTVSAHLLMSGKPLTVVSIHNHPSTQTFSLEDIQFFIGYSSVRLMVLVGNQGVIHYMSKNNRYIPENAYFLLHEFFKMIKGDMTVKEIINITEQFLKRCCEIGIDYHKGR